MRKLLAILLVVLFTFSLTACSGKKDTYEIALDLVKKERYSEAAEIFEKIADYKDSSEYIVYCIGREAAANGDIDTALALFKSLGSNDNNNIENELQRQKMLNDAVYIGPFCDDRQMISVNDLAGYIDREYRIVIDPVYHVAAPFSEGLAAVANAKGEWQFIDIYGNVALDTSWDEAGSFSDGFAAVCKNDKWGIIDKQGNVVIDFKYDGVESFDGEQAIVYLDGVAKLIDVHGNVLIDDFWARTMSW